ncbi:MAG: hypothetical protein GC139_09890 [Sideroxydans sp.]|nr:hypothetical protein [Sideroxydans sp.]
MKKNDQHEPTKGLPMQCRLITAILFVSFLAGCASAPTTPPEPEISVKLQGTAVEVQNFIEEHIRKNNGSGLHVESATDREIVFKANCMDMPNMNAFKCAAVMMGVGNSGWDGPFAVMTFRTSEIRGIVDVTTSTEWCATNAFGKTNCMQDGTNAERNEMLRKIDAAYQKEVRPLSK